MNKHDEVILIFVSKYIYSCLWVFVEILTSQRFICKLEFVPNCCHVFASTHNFRNKRYLFQVLVDINNLTLMLNADIF